MLGVYSILYWTSTVISTVFNSTLENTEGGVPMREKCPAQGEKGLMSCTVQLSAAHSSSFVPSIGPLGGSFERWRPLTGESARM